MALEGCSLSPILPTKQLPETLRFYRALGFEVLFEQEEPYLWATVRQGGIVLNFTNELKGPEKGGFICTVSVPEVEQLHTGFLKGLREAYGTIPLAGPPRLTRLRPGVFRVMTVDPDLNSLLFISRDEPTAVYDLYPGAWKELSPLGRSLGMAVWLRDLKGHDDAGAARVLDVALRREETGSALDLARVLAARAELAVALGEPERQVEMRRRLAEIDLSPAEREQFRDELEAAERLETLLRG